MRLCFRKSVLFFLAFASFFCSQALAWGPNGHKMVAGIAGKYMSQATQDSLKKYLGIMTFGSAATWMDDIKGTPEGDQMKPWHYINIAKGKNYVADPHDINVVNEIIRAYNNLKNKKNLTKDQVSFNIKVLFHLVGDLQQPLHTGYAEDRGGGSVSVTYNGSETDLHSLWDSRIISGTHITLGNCSSLYDHYTAAEKTASKQINVVGWLNTSRAYLGKVYDFKNGKIEAQYADWAKGVIEKQILDGGLHLAAIMDDVFHH